MSVALENAIYVSDKAKAKVQQLLADAGVANDPSYFLRVSVVGGGCSGLSYKLDLIMSKNQWTRYLKIMV